MQDENSDMDSEEEDMIMEKYGKRYRQLCREARRRAKQENKVKKTKKKRQQKADEKRREVDSSSDEENDTLASVKKQKLERRKKKKRRKKQLQNPSVLASLPSATDNELKTKSMSAKDDGEEVNKLEKDADKDNGIDKNAQTSSDDEEFEFDTAANTANEASVKLDADDADEDGSSSESESEDEEEDDFIGDEEECDSEDSNDDSDSEDSDDDIKLSDLGNSRVVDEEDKVKNIMSILETSVSEAKNELTRLKEMFTVLKRSMAKDDCYDKLKDLAKKGYVYLCPYACNVASILCVQTNEASSFRTYFPIH